MDDFNKNTYIVAEEHGNENIVIVSSAWLTPQKEDSYWPRYKHTAQYNKSLTKHETPDIKSWQLITLKRKFYETEDLITARNKAKQAESISDVNEDLEVCKKRKHMKPPQMIDSDSMSSEGSLELFGIGKTAGSNEKRNKVNEGLQYNSKDNGVPCFNQLNTEKEIRGSLYQCSRSADTQGTDITVTPKSTGKAAGNNKDICGSLNQYSRYDSPGTDITLTPKDPGVQQQKILHMLTTLVEQNNQILTWIRNQNECSLLKRTKEPVKLPVQLPICDENELATLEEYLNEDANFGEMCDYVMAFCGSSPTSSVNQILRNTITNELASKFSYRGKKGKRPFEQLNLKIVLIRTVKKHFKLPLETSIENDIKVWLKHAPQRVRTSLIKKQSSSSN